MSGQPLSGLTWDHPRGYQALEAAALVQPGLIQWQRQPLEGFESHPLAELAARFDLIVMDHPHIGEAAAEQCLQPVENFFGAAELQAWGQQSIGAALRSYRWGGQHFALPLDVAMQVMARDAERIDAAPDTWDEVIRLGEQQPTALSVAGPHALLSFFSIGLSLGEEPGGEDLVSEAVGRAALDMMRRLACNSPPGSSALNPIALLEALARRAGIALVPLVFGYVNYAAAAQPAQHRVRFSEAPRMAAGGRRGSVLGGTGIAISARARPEAGLLDHLRWLMAQETQCRFIPQHAGQPSARAAWLDETVNAASTGFYRETRETAESAWVRPRFDGYIHFQTQASALLREACKSNDDAAATLRRLRALWHAARSRARGPISL